MPVAKPIELSTGHYTKEEIEQRKEAEEKLKGNSDLVYEVPKQLKGKKEKDMYLFLVGELKVSNILNNLDINILIQTVNSIFQMEEANKKIKEFGQVIQKQDGSLQKNPAINIYKDYYSIFYQCCSQLGLSPMARSKLATLSLAKAEEDSDELLQILRS